MKKELPPNTCHIFYDTDFKNHSAGSYWDDFLCPLGIYPDPKTGLQPETVTVYFKAVEYDKGVSR